MNLHILPPRWRRALEILPRSLHIKTGLILLLIPAIIWLLLTNRDLLHKNETMLKYMRNGRVIQARFDALAAVRDSFSGYVAKPAPKTDPETLKTEHITRLLALISQNGLNTDSYLAETAERDGFLIFRYNIVIIGKFTSLISFYSALTQETPRFYVFSYDTELHQETLTRTGLRVEVPVEKNR